MRTAAARLAALPLIVQSASAAHRACLTARPEGTVFLRHSFGLSDHQWIGKRNNETCRRGGLR
jgi:hypothetical protein